MKFSHKESIKVLEKLGDEKVEYQNINFFYFQKASTILEYVLSKEYSKNEYIFNLKDQVEIIRLSPHPFEFDQSFCIRYYYLVVFPKMLYFDTLLEARYALQNLEKSKLVSQIEANF